MKSTLFAFFLSCALPLWAAIPGIPATGTKCPVCRMNIGPESKTAYSSTRMEAGKETVVHVCSYSCAHALHKKRPESPLMAHDFETGQPVKADEAWYVVKSAKISERVEFGMPPVVAAFQDETKAKALQETLKDGTVVHGLGAVDKSYEK